MKRVINFSEENKVKVKPVSLLKVGDWINTRPKGKPRNEQIISIEKGADERILNLTTESGVYQAVLGSFVLP